MADFEVNRRLKKLISEVYKTTPFDFSKKYDDRGGVKTSAIMRERNGVSNNMLDAICSAYPEINRTWLLTGEGQMFVDSQNSNSGTIVNNGGNGNSFFTHPEGVSGPCGGMIELLRKKDEQIDRLLTIIEHQNGINKE